MFASTRHAVASSSWMHARVISRFEGRTFAASAAAASLLELTRLERPTRREFSDFRAKSPSVPFLVGGALAELGWKLSEWSPKDLRDRFGDVEVPLEVRRE